MKNSFVFFAVLGLLAGGARAGVILDTSNPPGTPLTMSAGATSGLMSVSVLSNNPPNDIMAGWQFDLVIVPNGGATGTLTFQSPATGTPADPPNYIFGSNGLGIVDTNNGTTLTANDLFAGAGSGATVPGSPGANLLQMDFLASSGASGLFGIYAIEGPGATSWIDSSFNTQFFTNVPNGSSMVLIGDVLVTPPSGSSSVPEIPASGLGSGILVLGGTLMLLSSRRRIPSPTI
jgi:hypothetical protein